MSSMTCSELKAKGATTFQWKIENLSYWRKRIHNDFMSPEFNCASIPGHVFRLKLHPRKLERLCVELHLCRFKSVVLVDYELSFLDSVGWPLAVMSKQNQLIRDETPLPLEPSLNCRDVFRARAAAYLPEDTLTLRFSVCKSDYDDVVSEYIAAYTRVEIRQTCYLLPSDFFLGLELNQDIDIPICLTMSPKEPVFMNINVFLTGSSLEGSVFKFRIIHPEYEPMFLKFKISLLSKEQKVSEHWEDNYTFYTSTAAQVWVMANHLSRESLLDENNSTVSVMIGATTSELSHSIQKIVKTPAFFRFDFSSNDVPKADVSDRQCFEMP